MTRGLALLLVAALLAGSGLSAAASARPKGPARFYPDPSEILALEIAYNRRAQEKGQWAALRENAAEDAVMFVPEKVAAPLWLKGRKDSPLPARRDPWKAYVSCDARLAVATGTWQGADGAQGYFTTVWRRTAKGEWQWVLDHADRLAAPRDHVDYAEGHVASCKGLPGRTRDAGRDAPSSPPPPPPQQQPSSGKGGKQGEALPPPDDSLRWRYEVTPDGGRHVLVSLWNGSSYEDVIDDRVGPQR